MDKNKTKVEPEKSCETCLWDNVPRNKHCLACLDKDELIGWQQKYKMKNVLEESWNKYKAELIARDYIIQPDDRIFFQAGFNAASKLFRKTNITSAMHSDGKDLCNCENGYPQSTGGCPVHGVKY